MKLVILRHLWGLPGTLAELLPTLRQRGYDGVEAALPPNAEQTSWREMLESTQSHFVAQIFTAGQTVAEQMRSFREQVTAAQEMSPILINCHSGSDAWAYEDSLLFCREAVRIEVDLGIPVAHETHRRRIFFHPWITQRLVQEVADLWLCADFSHWVCVCERLLDDREDVMQTCIARTRHVHARVGFEEGPQVPDPRVPEYRQQVAAHEAWWQAIWQAQRVCGEPVSTLTPEFGPPLICTPYLIRKCHWLI